MSDLYVNGRFLDQPLTGVQRYARALMQQVDFFIGKEQPYAGLSVTCLVPPGKRIAPFPAWKNIEIRVIGRNQNNLWEQVDLPLYVKGKFLFSPTNLGPFFYPNQAVTIHDASVFAMPKAYSLMFRMKYRLGISLLASTARLILTDSNFSRVELSKYLKLPPERFQVVYLGSDHLDETAFDEGMLDAWRLREKPYFLVVASQSPHKNIAGLLKTVDQLQANVQFVLVGGSYKTVFRDSQYQLPANVLQLGYIDDSNLKALYRRALGLIFPSRYEGFGLPVLEAMRHGCPVLCSTAASLPEVGGDAVLYFDPQNPDEITAVLTRFLADPALQAELKSRGLARAGQFLWKTTTQKTLELLTPLISRGYHGI